MYHTKIQFPLHNQSLVLVLSPLMATKLVISVISLARSVFEEYAIMWIEGEAQGTLVLCKRGRKSKLNTIGPHGSSIESGEYKLSKLHQAGHLCQVHTTSFLSTQRFSTMLD